MKKAVVVLRGINFTATKTLKFQEVPRQKELIDLAQSFLFKGALYGISIDEVAHHLETKKVLGFFTRRVFDVWLSCRINIQIEFPVDPWRDPEDLIATFFRSAGWKIDKAYTEQLRLIS